MNDMEEKYQKMLEEAGSREKLEKELIKDQKEKLVGIQDDCSSLVEDVGKEEKVPAGLVEGLCDAICRLCDNYKITLLLYEARMEG